MNTGGGRPAPVAQPPWPGYTFRQSALLERALTHRSSNAAHNERLEFLGDTVLSLLITEELYRRYPDADEGKLSRLRVALVNNRTLVRLAGQLSLATRLYTGDGVTQPSGAMLADGMEAVIGAIYLDAGLERCRELVLGWYERELQGLSQQYSGRSAKMELQEYLQARGEPLPVYHLLGEHGKPHQREFTILCATAGGCATARARSKVEAGQQAAQALLQRFTAGAARSAREELDECLGCLGRPAAVYRVLATTGAAAPGECTIECTIARAPGEVGPGVIVRGSGARTAAEAQAAARMLARLLAGEAA